MISFTRGDTRAFKFVRREKQSGEIIDIEPTKIWVTVKKSECDPEVLIQKTIDDFKFTKSDSYLHFRFDPEDTERLPYGQYFMDIEVLQKGSETNVKTTIYKGYLRLTSEATWAINEV